MGISMAGLASAVANAGGIGVIAAAMAGINEPDVHSKPAEANTRVLSREIKAARAATKGILGVNIMVALTHYSELVQTAIKEKIDIIFAGAGLPLDLPGYLSDGAKTKLVPIVSSARAAILICKRWLSRYNCLPDGFVVEGPKAGGHLGFKPGDLDSPDFSLENLLQSVLAALKPYELQGRRRIPVRPGGGFRDRGGGIYNGADIHRHPSIGSPGCSDGHPLRGYS